MSRERWIKIIAIPSCRCRTATKKKKKMKTKHEEDGASKMKQKTTKSAKGEVLAALQSPLFSSRLTRGRIVVWRPGAYIKIYLAPRSRSDVVDFMAKAIYGEEEGRRRTRVFSNRGSVISGTRRVLLTRILYCHRTPGSLDNGRSPYRQASDWSRLWYVRTRTRRTRTRTCAGTPLPARARHVRFTRPGTAKGAKPLIWRRMRKEGANQCNLRSGQLENPGIWAHRGRDSRSDYLPRRTVAVLQARLVAPAARSRARKSSSTFP